MPFAPSILHERTKDYFVNPKEFFTIHDNLFESTELARTHLPAGLHPADYTEDRRW